jgi:hypothetical protein
MLCERREFRNRIILHFTSNEFNKIINFSNIRIIKFLRNAKIRYWKEFQANMVEILPESCLNNLDSNDKYIYE